jgi:hypothetical protein
MGLRSAKEKLLSSRALLRIALFLGVPLSIVGGVRAVSWAAAQLKTWANGDTLTADDLNGNFAALQSAITSASTVNYDYWDSDMHKPASKPMSVVQALCTARFGIWDATNSVCTSPLTYGTAYVPRTDSDGAAVSNCPPGFTPADCHSALFLLNFWRLNPNRETTGGQAWCAGTVDGTLNSTAQALAGEPGYWYAAGASAPQVCPSGQALVVDQCAPGEMGCVGRASYPRPHLYCNSTATTNPWMCISTSLF